MVISELERELYDPDFRRSDLVYESILELEPKIKSRKHEYKHGIIGSAIILGSILWRIESVDKKLDRYKNPSEVNKMGEVAQITKAIRYASHLLNSGLSINQVYDKLKIRAFEKLRELLQIYNEDLKNLASPPKKESKRIYDLASIYLREDLKSLHIDHINGTFKKLGKSIEDKFLDEEETKEYKLFDEMYCKAKEGIEKIRLVAGRLSRENNLISKVLEELVLRQN